MNNRLSVATFIPRHASLTACLIAAAAALACGSSGHAQDDRSLTADAIIQRYVAGNRSSSEMAYIKMVTEAPGAPAVERRLLLAYQKAGESDALFMRLLHPKEVEGVTLLATTAKEADPAYHFLLPTLGKMRQLTPEGRRGAFLGSDYTFEDLLQEVPELHDYQRQADDEVEGMPCFVIRATESKKEKESAYAYRDLYIEKDSFHLRKINYYDRRESLAKRLRASGYDSKDVKGRTKRPQQAEMLAVEAETKTTFTVIEGRLDEKIDPALFTPQKLESWSVLDVEEFIFGLGMTVDTK